ncbi:hypothetical protein ACOME3_004826 [Neoechinorhynchus agilis]
MCNCALAPLSYKQETVSDVPVMYWVKTSVYYPDSCNAKCICIFKVAVDLTNGINPYTLVAIKCNVRLDDEIETF